MEYELTKRDKKEDRQHRDGNQQIFHLWAATFLWFRFLVPEDRFGWLIVFVNELWKMKSTQSKCVGSEVCPRIHFENKIVVGIEKEFS